MTAEGTGLISFVGAGPGAADLVTLRGAARLAEADVVIWASSLVPEAVLAHVGPGSVVLDSAGMTLEDVLRAYEENVGRRIVRLHSGDPSLYGALEEQLEWCRHRERPFEIVPGVSSVFAAAAAVGRELTVPQVAQSVILTRLGHRTRASVPEREQLRRLAAHGATMAVFLSASQPERLQAELLSPPSAYSTETPIAVVVRATHPDEQVIQGTLGQLAAAIRSSGTTTTVLVLIGEALGRGGGRSHLYDPTFAHGQRRRSLPGTDTGRPAGPAAARQAARAAGARFADRLDSRRTSSAVPAAFSVSSAEGVAVASFVTDELARDRESAPLRPTARSADLDAAVSARPVSVGFPPLLAPGHVVVIGLGPLRAPSAEAVDLLADALAAADLVVGSPANLQAVGVRPDDPRALPLGSVADAVRRVAACHGVALVLASGDPGFFGILRPLSAAIAADRLVVAPAPSAVALAFARLALPWDQALVVSAHGRPLRDALAIVRQALGAPDPGRLTPTEDGADEVGPRPSAIALLCGPGAAPETIAERLGDLSEEISEVAIATALGEPDERVARCSLDWAAGRTWPERAVMILLPRPSGSEVITAGDRDPAPGPVGRPRPGVPTRPGSAWFASRTRLPSDVEPSAPPPGRPEPDAARSAVTLTTGSFGRPDHLYAHPRGQITKAEVRAVVLAHLRLPPTGVLWDLGAGSGSIAIEASLLSPGLEVVAVERDPERVATIRRNAEAAGARLEVICGEAPAVLDQLPLPDRVVVGGGGLDVLDSALARLRPGGRLVATFAAMDRAAAAADRLGALVAVQVSRAERLPDGGLRLQALNPVFVVHGPQSPTEPEDPVRDAVEERSSDDPGPTGRSLREPGPSGARPADGRLPGPTDADSDIPAPSEVASDPPETVRRREP